MAQRFMKMRLDTRFSAIYLAALFGLFVSLSATQALAQAPPACLPGVPCIVNKTINDPATPAAEPNVAPAPNARKSGSTMCDADFMNQIYARAYNESEREIVMNAVVVRKPDSILEYTCYDQIVRMTGVHAGPLFTESRAWDGVTVNIPGASPVILRVNMGTSKLDTSLENTVLVSLGNYISSNFAHSFLGGTSTGLSATTPAAGSYNCDLMNSVHFLAKCNDFATDDQFLSFSTLATPLDPRALPAACTPATTKITTALINVANNNAYTHANFDPVQTYLTRLDGTSACGTPIATGIQNVQRHEYNVAGPVGNVSRTPLGTVTDPYEEKVCVNPGCFYNYATNTCVR